MAKFIIKCPKCDTVYTVKTGIFAKKTINCGHCKELINIGDARMTTKKCPHCGEYNLTHRVCKACGYYDGKEIIKKEA